jgi:hypothetical protein
MTVEDEARDLLARMGVLNAHAFTSGDLVDLANMLSDQHAARRIIKDERDFDAWAQSYLDSGRWAGHSNSDAVKQELLERDAKVANLIAERDLLRHLLAQAAEREAEYADRVGDSLRRSFGLGPRPSRVE